jgi:hypothetical protein
MHAKPWCKRLLLQASTMLIHSNAAFHTTLQRLQRVQNGKIVSRTTKIPHHFRAEAIFMTNLLFSSLLWALSFSD